MMFVPPSASRCGAPSLNVLVSVPRAQTHSLCGTRPLPARRSVAKWYVSGASRPRSSLIKLSATANSQAKSSSSAKTVVVVLGASRGLGKALVQRLRADGGFIVHAAARSSCDEVAESEHSHQLDARNPQEVHSLLEQTRPDMIVNCVAPGEADGLDEYPAYSYAVTSQCVDACLGMKAKEKAPLFILVSALGAGDSEDSIPSQVKDNMRGMLLDKSRAEKHVRTNYVHEYIIVRPAPLVDEDATGKGMLTESINAYGAISREDLADLIVQLLKAPRSASGKVLTAVDSTKVLHVSPYIRNYEFWEKLPFEAFELV